MLHYKADKNHSNLKVPLKTMQIYTVCVQKNRIMATKQVGEEI